MSKHLEARLATVVAALAKKQAFLLKLNPSANRQKLEGHIRSLAREVDELKVRIRRGPCQSEAYLTTALAEWVKLRSSRVPEDSEVDLIIEADSGSKMCPISDTGRVILHTAAPSLEGFRGYIYQHRWQHYGFYVSSNPSHFCKHEGGLKFPVATAWGSRL